jgi:peptide/nickel transport system permease protein
MTVETIKADLQKTPTRSWFSSKARIWRKNPSFFWGMIIVTMVVLVAIFSDRLVPFDPIKQDWKNTLSAPNAQHWLGTDNYGRDVFSRILASTRLDLTIGFLAVLFPLVIGIIIGTLAGYYGGLLDQILMRLVDIIVAFPFIVLIILLIAAIGTGLQNVVIAVTIGSWVIYARIVRSEVLVQKNLEYVMSARTLGFSDFRIMLRHILPNAVSTVIIFAALDIALDILLIATLGFLGLGVKPPTPEWGSIASEGLGFIASAPWISFFPGIAIIITGTGFALLADGLADVLRAGGQEA